MTCVHGRTHHDAASGADEALTPCSGDALNEVPGIAGERILAAVDAPAGKEARNDDGALLVARGGDACASSTPGAPAKSVSSSYSNIRIVTPEFFLRERGP
ncbi:hypothetical protein JXA88_07940 [Candidatus Fermentibacteria bacterium]|nr:hypothetical protein [Candidatus Fermentibacteria bacterium]